MAECTLLTFLGQNSSSWLSGTNWNRSTLNLGWLRKEPMRWNHRTFRPMRGVSVPRPSYVFLWQLFIEYLLWYGTWGWKDRQRPSTTEIIIYWGKHFENAFIKCHHPAAYHGGWGPRLGNQKTWVCIPGKWLWATQYPSVSISTFVNGDDNNGNYSISCLKWCPTQWVLNNTTKVYIVKKKGGSPVCLQSVFLMWPQGREEPHPQPLSPVSF